MMLKSILSRLEGQTIEDKKKGFLVLLLIGGSFFFLCNFIYDWEPSILDGKKIFGRKIYYVGFAFYTFLFSSSALYVFPHWVTRILFWAAFGSLLDELFGSPVKPDLIEYLGLLFLIIYELRKHYNRKKIT